MAGRAGGFPDPSFEVSRKELYDAFRAFFKERSGEEWRSGDVHFFRKLNDIYGKVEDRRANDGGKRAYMRPGIRLNRDWAGGKIGG